MTDDERAELEARWEMQVEARRFSAIHRAADEFETVLGGERAVSSGVFVRVGSDVVVAMSGHQIQLGHRDPAKYFGFVADGMPPHNEAWRATAIMQRGGRSTDDDEPWDLGWVHIANALPSLLGRAAVPMDRIDVEYEPDPNDWLFVHGASEDLITTSLHPSGEDLHTAHEWGFRTNPLATPPRGLTNRRGVDLFIEYEPESRGPNNEPMKTPSGKGLSGAGVWAVNKRALVWMPSMMRLVGIVRNTSVRDGWIRATHIRHWVHGIAVM